MCIADLHNEWVCVLQNFTSVRKHGMIEKYKGVWLEMERKMLWKAEDPGKTMQFLLLLAAGISVLLFVPIDSLFPGMGYFFAEKWLAVPSLLFAGSVLCQRHSGEVKKRLLLSGITVLWFTAVQLQHHLSEMGSASFGLFAVVYILAFPFAAVSEEDNRRRGITWIGMSYVACSVLLIVLTGMLLLETVPETLTARVFWDGTRLNALWHPNASAGVFMLGIGFCLYFLVQTQKTWIRILLAALTAIEFGAMILTNSRTSILLTCGIFGGTLFFRIWKGGWKRFFVSAAAALAVIAALFFLSGELFDLHTQVRHNKMLHQLEKTHEAGDDQHVQLTEKADEIELTGASPQGSFAEDMWTLNGRTYIWKSAFTALRDNPSIVKWGTEYANIEISSRNHFPVAHSHNSWVEILMRLGIVGFVLALAYTAIAIKSLWRIFWHLGFGLSRKVVAMIVLCTMAAGFLEPYLFIGDISTLFVNFIFFFCTGYLDCWSMEKPDKRNIR